MKNVFFVFIAILLTVTVEAKRKPSQVTGDFGKLLTTGLKCTGTEPFWNVEVNNKEVTFQDPVMNTKKSRYKIDGKYSPTNYDSWGIVVKAQSRVLTIRADNTCNDGMTDENYPFEITYISGSIVYVGCCKPK